MAYVTVPKDLTHVKSKVLFGLTKRQLVCFGGALLTGGPLYFLTRDYLSNSAAALLMIFAMLPGLLFALFERHGQPLEVVIQQMIQCCFIRPKERPYLGASDAHLAAGATVLGSTSAPIGGDSTNCVIAGHRGWRGADYFRHIDKLAVGDEVRITNLWETLTYTVADIQIIQPHEVDKIKIQQGRDLLTLLTCHPYASGGRQRYVVYCERTG